MLSPEQLLLWWSFPLAGLLMAWGIYQLLELIKLKQTSH